MAEISYAEARSNAFSALRIVAWHNKLLRATIFGCSDSGSTNSNSMFTFLMWQLNAMTMQKCRKNDMRTTTMIAKAWKIAEIYVKTRLSSRRSQ